MQKRLTSLDGLRGFAALAVTLSHLDNRLILQATGPWITAVFRTIAAGPNAVQIFFVLSGFLMAYLYPSINNPIRFIQKRYTRIFPTFIVVVLFFWLITFVSQFQSWPIQIALIFGISALGRYICKGVKTIDKTGKIGKIILYIFLGLQAIVLLVLIFILPHLSTLVFSNITILFANLTLTTPFGVNILRYNSVFWSLTPEILFYLIFPFFVIPFLNIAKKWNWIIGLVLIITTTKIVFDIDHELMLQEGLQAVNIARASGFIAGVTIGTIYQQQLNIWKISEKILKNPWVNILIIIAFIFLQWKDASFRDEGNAITYNYFYLVSSWVFAITILASLIPTTLLNKIFSHKIFIFLGTISYSLYLTHIQPITWTIEILSPLKAQGPIQIYVLILILIATGFCIGVSWIVYKLVDSIYFDFRKQTTKTRQLIKDPQKKATFIQQRYIVITMLAYVLIIIIIYSGRFSPSLLIQRGNALIVNKELNSNRLIINQAKLFPFTSTYNNLSIFALPLHYKNNFSQKNNSSKLRFRLFNSQKKLIFESQTDPRLLNGGSEFQFGFPSIFASKQKNYIAELTLLKANQHEEVIMDSYPTNFITMYLQQKNLFFPIRLFWNRLSFTLTTPPGFFALLLIPFFIVLTNNNFRKIQPTRTSIIKNI